VTLRDSVRIALRSMVSHRLRSLLTMLGLTIGVAAVILLVAVGNGAQKVILASLENFGTNVIFIVPRGEIGANRVGTEGRQIELTLDDVAALRRRGEAAGIREVVPVINPAAPKMTWRGGTFTPSAFAGAPPPYLSVQNYSMARGRFYTEAEDRERRRVLVVGQTVVDELFDGEDPVGQRVSVKGVTFEVIGVLESRGGAFFDEDDIALAPFNAVESTMTGPDPPLASIIAQATSRQAIPVAVREVWATLMETHRIDDPDDVDFQVFNASSVVEAADQSARVFTILLAGVAGISLLVGGIGVMNIMLVTVSERTREIGIRKAIGAQRSDIVGQFLLEALVLSCLGGFAGVLLGVGLGQIGNEEFQPIVTTGSVVIAFMVAVLVGLFFGIYPANHAAAMRPIDALRHE
jgi:putative ABC transport system permease protein